MYEKRSTNEKKNRFIMIQQQQSLKNIKDADKIKEILHNVSISSDENCLKNCKLSIYEKPVESNEKDKFINLCFIHN